MFGNRPVIALISTMFLLQAGPTFAALHGRLPATPGGTDYQVYYDDDLGITFLANAQLGRTEIFGLLRDEYLGPHPDDPLYDPSNPGSGASNGYIDTYGAMNYAGVLFWLDAMNAANYLGFHNWRLPLDVDRDPTCDNTYTFNDIDDYTIKHTVDFGNGCAGGELGHLIFQEGVLSSTPAPFKNVVSYQYWTSTDAPWNVLFSWTLHLGNGDKNFSNKQLNYYPWPVLDGDVAGEPPPPDFDHDGFTDDEELNGLDADGDGSVDLDLPALGADPCRKTIVVEIDYMDGTTTGGFSHTPHPDLIATVAAAFDAAPAPAPAGCPYSGFPLRAGGYNFIGYVDEEVPEQTGTFSVGSDLSSYRETYFNEDLLPWVHYVLYVHELASDSTTSGICCNQGGFLVSMGKWTVNNASSYGSVNFFDPAGDPDDKLRKEAGTFMHELGHALGLGHGGYDSVNYKPNYISVMNYQHQTDWLINTDDLDHRVLDYSREALPELDERELYETNALCTHVGCLPWLTVWFTGTHFVGGRITQAPDWNADGAHDTAPVAVDINNVNDDSCVQDGPNATLDTTPAGDDVLAPPFITAGPDQTCETTVAAGSDDWQLARPGTLPNLVYSGHDDWSAIRLLAEENAYGAGIGSYQVSNSPEITAEEAQQWNDFWDGVVAELTGGGSPPVADAAGPYSVDEGDMVALDSSGSYDPDGGALTYDWDLDGDAAFGEASPAGANGAEAGPSPLFDASVLDGPDVVAVTLRVVDQDGGEDTSGSSVTVNNVAPVLGDLSGPADPVPVGTTIATSADFTDAGVLDTHSGDWDWGDGDSGAGTVSEAGGSGSVTGSHAYAEAGIYVVGLTLDDDDGGADTGEFKYVVVYDPEGSFVTGGGAIDSPPGAWAPDPTLTGLASFGFVSKYRKGANTPTGHTEFQFHAAGFDFRSTDYQWLVVAGSRAQFKGTGAWPGDETSYGFMLTAIDGDLNGSGPDRFRIKIWNTQTGDILYDNQIGSDDGADPTTAIRQGSIVIHGKGEK